MSQDVVLQSVEVHTNSFEELCDSAAGWDQQYTQLSPGAFKGLLDMRQVGNQQIFREYFSQKIRYQGTAPPGGFGFGLTLDQPADSNWVGQSVSRNTVVIQAPGQEADFVTSGQWDSIVLAVPDDEVHDIALALSGRDSFSNQFHCTCTLPPVAADRLRTAGREYLRVSRNAGPDMHAQIAQRSNQFVKLFLWEIIDAQEEDAPPPAASKRIMLVRQASDMVMSDHFGHIGLTEICAELDVSLRTLHYAFKEVTDMSPAAWLRAIRLNRIHRDLLECSPDDILIKQLAIANGFFHLGHFSMLYKRHFGVLPSDTLQAH